MTRRLALVRHSNPIIDPEIPAREWRLSDEGRSRSTMAAEALAGESASRIVTSNEPKAIDTAEEIGHILGLPIAIVSGIHEHERPRLPFYEATEWRRLIEELFANPDSLVLGHETARQAKIRFTSAIETLARSEPDHDLIVVTHGTVMALYVSSLLAQDPFTTWKSLDMPDVRIVPLDIGD